MKQHIVAGLAAAVIAGGLIASAPPAGAGCQYGGTATISRCDGPVQPDGTWQRCVVFSYITGGGSGSRDSYSAPGHRCDVMGPDQHPWGMAFNDPAHIDD
jgi:hypothetical protein